MRVQGTIVGLTRVQFKRWSPFVPRPGAERITGTAPERAQSRFPRGPLRAFDAGVRKAYPTKAEGQEGGDAMRLRTRTLGHVLASVGSVLAAVLAGGAWWRY
jgi:hypothetical protein